MTIYHTSFIGVGLAIAAGVAYAELKPKNPTTPSQTTSSNPSESASPAPSTAPVQEAPASQLIQTAQPKLKNPNSKPQISGGEHERSESREHEGREREGGEDD